MADYQFTPEQYTSFQDFVTEYVRDKAKSNLIPNGKTDAPWQKQFKHYKRPQGVASLAGSELSFQAPNNAQHVEATSVDLEVRQLSVELGWDKLSMPKNPLLDDSVKDSISQIMYDAQISIFGNSKVSTALGLRAGAGSVTASDATIQTYGDFIKLVDEMVTAIPARYREQNVKPIMIMTDGLIREAHKLKNTTTNESEWVSCLREYVLGTDGVPGELQGIYSCNFLHGWDTTPDDNYKKMLTPATTNQRAAIFIPDKRFIEVITSFPLGITKAIELPFGVDVGIAWMGGCIVKDTNAVKISQDLTVDSGMV